MVREHITEPGTGTEKVSAFLSETRFEHIPAEAVRAAKDALVDWLAVALAGSRDRSTGIIGGYLEEFGARGEASVIGRGFRTTAELAALANGTIGHALDFDDTFANSTRYNLHPSTCVFPATLALIEREGLTGRDLLAAYITGMEVTYRLGMAIGHLIPRTGWHSTPVMGTMGAAAAGINALHLAPEQARNALGIAASLAGGLLRNTGTMTKPMHAGNGARNGVLATLLAQRGFTANQEILEGKGGYCFMFGDGESTGLNGADADLGEDWQLGRIGLGLKPYPICRSTHASIDAMLTLRREHGLRPEDVAEIVCRICPIHTQFCRFHRPQTAYEGKFSITYALATALRNGKIAISDFTDEKVTDPAVRAVLEKVRFEYPDGWGKGAVDLHTEITVRLKSGESFACDVPLPRGEPENPMTDAELDGKFTDCGLLVLKKKEVKKALDIIRHIEEVDDLTVLWQLLNKGN